MDRRWLWLLAAVLAGLLALWAPLATDARIVLAILAFAMVMWLSEAVPLAITALAAAMLLILVAGRPPKEVFGAFFDPVIVLLLGGFFLGVALSKHGLDTRLAALVMRRSGSRPAMILLAIMMTTAVFSMWISNTAATAIMLPIALGIVVTNQGHGNLARNLVLGVAFAANIGGIATPIGTTANPIALRFLNEAGASITFFGWMARALPLALALVLLVWSVLLRVYPLAGDRLQVPETTGRTTRAQIGVMAVFAVTVALWLTTDLHGVTAPVVAILPILLLFAARLLDEADIHKVGWPTLLLIGGGLALGDAVTSSGLDSAFAGLVAQVVGGERTLVAFIAIGVAAVIMTVFASNTAAAVIMIPIVIQLATDWDIALPAITMLAAVALSLDFMVPVGTPPNAMAYGTGHVNVRQMAQAGIVATVLGLALTIVVAWSLW